MFWGPDSLHLKGKIWWVKLLVNIVPLFKDNHWSIIDCVSVMTKFLYCSVHYCLSQKAELEGSFVLNNCVASLLLCINWHLKHRSFSNSCPVGMLVNFTSNLNNTALSECFSIPALYKIRRLSVACPVHVLLNLSAQLLNSVLSECCLDFPDKAVSHFLQCPTSI
jgi:hypothetical protein